MVSGSLTKRDFGQFSCRDYPELIANAAEFVTRGTIRLSEISLLNQSVSIRLEDGTGWVAKCNDWTVPAFSSGTERRVYETLAAIPASGLGRYLPHLGTDANSETALVIDLICGARSLRSGRESGSFGIQDLTDELAHALASIHRISFEDVRKSGFKRVSPWTIQLESFGIDAFATASTGCELFMSLVQEHVILLNQLLSLRSEWCGSASLIHNDLKWDNILVHSKEGETERMDVKIIDWEMAGVGDPCWDVGTVLSEFVAFWATSIPVVGGEPYEELAKYPIEDMQPAIRAFWESYAEAMEFDRATARKRLIKSVRFAGARLIQTAYERTQTMTHLTPHIYLLLQLSLNIMEGPEDAAEGLFGIPLPDGVSA